MLRAQSLCKNETVKSLLTALTRTHPDDAVNDSGCDEWCHKTLCWGELLDNTEIRRYVLLSNVCLNV